MDANATIPTRGGSQVESRAAVPAVVVAGGYQRLINLE